MAYLRPRELGTALDALATGDWTVLAGGTDHFPARVGVCAPEDILDIGMLAGLRTIRRDDGDWLIPAQATWSDVVAASGRDGGLPFAFDGLAAAARQVGGVQVQNAGTVVGNVCTASPAADGMPCLLALDAQVDLASREGVRSVPLDLFVTGARRTLRRPDELVLGLRIPDVPWRSGFQKLGARAYLVISVAMVAVAVRCLGGRITEARVAVGACAARAVRLAGLEASLIGQDPARADLDPAHFDVLTPIDDIRAPAAYRRVAARELTRRALAALA